MLFEFAIHFFVLFLRMQTFLLLLAFLPFTLLGQWDQNTTPTYPELIEIYQQWDAAHEEIEFYAMGNSDTEYPLYVCIINGAKDSVATFQKAKSSTTVLINNAIHPGEPDGVNACLLWIQDWIKKGKNTTDLPMIAIIPAYNVGGMMNRSSTSRANQEGPEEYGFRGNAQNLDLNRDFIKMDSENAKTLVSIYHALDPDVFVDTHVSNGADYQYTLTLIHPMKERMAPSMKALVYKDYIVEMTQKLKKKGWDWAPYVETKATIPDSGIVAFNDTPRYAQGFGTLMNAFSITVETHMLKPFPQRVKATKDYLNFLISWSGLNSAKIEQARSEALSYFDQQNHYKFQFELDEQQFDTIVFKGYQSAYKTSEVSGMRRLFYDRTQPFTKHIRYYHHYFAKDSVAIPAYYIVSKEAKAIIERLQWNQVDMKVMDSDTLLVQAQRIGSFASGSRPYEGHFLHTNVSSFETQDSIRIPKGSYMISTHQAKRNFIVSVLEPRTEDAYFAWNFMDSYVQEKEYFSDYVFEDIAAKILKEQPELAKELSIQKNKNKKLATEAWDQLFFIYKNSPYFEKATFNRLPVYKLY